jgi:hypothetical protein
MIILNAQQLQRLAESLLRVERMLEAAGADATRIEEGLEEVAGRLGVHLDIVRMADPATLVAVLDPEGRGDAGKLWAAAEILFLDGLLALAREGRTAALGRMERARFLYGRVSPYAKLPHGTVPPSERLQEIEARISLADEA